MSQAWSRSIFALEEFLFPSGSTCDHQVILNVVPPREGKNAKIYLFKLTLRTPMKWRNFNWNANFVTHFINDNNFSFCICCRIIEWPNFIIFATTFWAHQFLSLSQGFFLLIKVTLSWKRTRTFIDLLELLRYFSTWLFSIIKFHQSFHLF